jgi:hypothetical protein
MIRLLVMACSTRLAIADMLLVLVVVVVMALFGYYNTRFGRCTCDATCRNVPECGKPLVCWTFSPYYYILHPISLLTLMQ